jgi:hypothetical protein
VHVARPLLFALPVAAAALAWWLLVRTPAAPGSRTEGLERARSRDRSALEAPPIEATLARPDARAVEPEDPEWITRPLALPAGSGSLKGTELIQAVETGGKVRFRGATQADLEALKRAVFEEVDRAAEHPHAAMMGWLKEAGFEVEVVYPNLIVRRRTDEDWTGR